MQRRQLKYIGAEAKWQPFGLQLFFRFRFIFWYRKLDILTPNVKEKGSLKSDWQQVSIDSNYGLAPNMQLSIIFINALSLDNLSVKIRFNKRDTAG